MSVFSYPARTIIIDSAMTTAEGIPFTPWMPATAISDVRTVLRIRDIVDTSIVEVQAAYQTADTDTDDPNAWTRLESTDNWASSSTPDLYARNGSFSAAGEYFVRFGVFVKNASADGDWKRAQVTLLVSGRD